MNNILKSIVASVVAAVVVVVIALSYSAPHTTTVVPRAGGAPDLSNSPYLNVNGTIDWYSQVAMPNNAVSSGATTTVCSFQSPVAGTNGSAALRAVSVRFGNQPTSGITFSIGTSTTAQGSSGTLVTGASAATSTGYYLPVTTTSTDVIASSTFTNVVLSGLASTTGGTCLAEFTQF